MAQVQRLLPEEFVFHRYSGNREGYALYRWIDGGDDNQNRKIHALRPLPHGGLYYDIIDDPILPTEYTIAQTKKSQGTIVSTMTWRYTGKVLRYQGAHGNRRYPVIGITNSSTTLPKYKASSFIPLVAPGAPAVPAAPAAPVAPLQNVPKIYTIATIPHHAVRAMLRDAAMQEESCPITGEEIDIVNGAITSCFHYFEKNAIATWLALPNSQDKCPVCNNKCNMFTI